MDFNAGFPQDLHDRLDGGWQHHLNSGTITYDPSRALSFSCDGLTFRHIPGRSGRPQPRSDSTPPGLRTPHQPCPFDDPDRLVSRQGFPYERGGRRYHVVVNRFPITHRHYLVVRSPMAETEVLPQCLFGAAEIEDLLIFARALGPAYRSSFNSNPGHDQSHSGASINHWHSHFLPLRGGPIEIPIADTSAPDDVVRLETIAELRVPHRVYRSTDTRQLADRIWEDARQVVELDYAFNLEIFASEKKPNVGEYGLGAALFVRHPVEPVEIPDVGTFAGRFGGFELTGNVVVYDKAVYDWMQARPELAAEMAWKRLKRGTRDIWSQ